MTNTIDYIRQSLQDYYPTNEIAALTRIIMERVTNTPYYKIISDKNNKITAEQLKNIQGIVHRLQNYEPIQYIMGQTEFYGLRFDLNENVLIPRPETEELVDLVISNNKGVRKRILDIGTGSGCIAVSIKKNLPDSEVYAWDISPLALDVAEKNAERNKTKIHFSEIDILGEYPKEYFYDIIVSNPPYVLESDKADMYENVLNFEPHIALFVPDEKALIFYERISNVASTLLLQDGQLYLEIHYQKGQDIKKLLENKGYKEVNIIKDMSGKDRIISAKYSHS